MNRTFPFLAVLGLSLLASSITADEMPWIAVSNDKQTFIDESSGKPFIVWGFNYDHDEDGRLIEDYWQSEWPKLESDFREMKALGANVIRIHLQLGKFMERADRPNATALGQLRRLLRLAEESRLYLNLTGLGCYHKADVPAWYDALSESERWNVQARFWQAIADQCAESPAVFCYDLMNEPVVPGGRRKEGDWLGPPFAGKHFVQFIALDQQDRPRPQIAQQWVKHLTTALRARDQRHLVTVGLVDWSLERPGLTSGFVPRQIADELDFISVHIYPDSGKIEQAIDTLSGFRVGKPVLIEEIFPLKCTPRELESFLDESRQQASGWIGFYWGKTPHELRQGKSWADLITLAWLEIFKSRAKADP